MDKVCYLEEVEIEAVDEEEAGDKYFKMIERGKIREMGRGELAFKITLVESSKDKLIKEISQNLEDFAQGYPDYTAKQKDIVKKMANLLQEAKIMIKHKVID